MNKLLVIGFSFGYLALLFGVAYAAERRSAARRSLVSNPYVYALSMAVYCTAWTYYGSVGHAARHGLEFVVIYLGPTLLAPAWWLVLRKIIRICRLQRLTSIADFISARYGKSASLGALVTVVCVLGIIPYISLQIKAIAASFDIMTRGAAAANTVVAGGAAANSALYTTVALAFFTIIFGVRSVEATERHEGMVLAVAVESLVKLIAFLGVGLFVTFGLFDGFGDVFEQAAAAPALNRLFTLSGAGTSPTQWLTLLLLSVSAILLLPRQFQVSVVENVNEDHLRKAMWLFPLYLIIINLFVLPIAFGGVLLYGGSGLDADTFVLALPLNSGQRWLALLTYLGGLSAASSMIIVETIALSVMMSNNLLMPLLVRVPAARTEIRTRWFAYLSQVALQSRRLAVVLVLLLAYGYYAVVGHLLPLVNIGLVSFAAVAQFLPVVLGSLYWKGGTRQGATAGILGGFLVWFFTLVLPTLVGPGLLPTSLLTDGLLGLSGLRPFALFGMEGLDYLSHGLFWSWFFNVGLYLGVSLAGRPTALEERQADVFVDVFRYRTVFEEPSGWPSTAAPLPDLRALLTGFLGKKRTAQALHAFAERFPDADNHSADAIALQADPRLVAYAEKLLAGSIGPASARLLLSSAVGVEEISFDNVVGILKESQQVLEANRQLQKQSRQLQRLTEDLRDAYTQLQELDMRKDEFLYTVTHELRTPLTSIRALSEILSDNPEIEEEERLRFLHTITRESERLSRLITLVLDLEKYESGKATLDCAPLDVAEIINDAIESVGQLMRAKHLQLEVAVPPGLPLLSGDRDRLMQVLVNLLSNAIKSCRADGGGQIGVVVETTSEALRISVLDNGKGIDPAYHELIFDKFFQAQNQTTRKPEGSGLGLAITKKIVELHAGRIWVESAPDQGARFSVELPTSASNT
ncbi:Histidine kinase [Hymenobacter roseosalivarius DSM 11622]|uniref:histidine kinase n=1 Tax=Hymenobacter roseosalivarius DSM 11622 TaxID=645990 RepID=A0A1W1W3Q2_9BACT|nr:sensor histidine kinase [Hymenobacter roseosalivarius]SMC00226.1 Histidine kinase [Hymenobacter roseosalivarius DSM 11622]